MKPPTVFLGEMTNLEVEEFLRTRHTVIVPTGATEQHGPHGPLLTDVLIPQEVARRVAPTIGAVVAPPINYALSYPHVGFTGLVHIRIPTFMALIEDLCASFAASGFKRIIFLNGHYDNTYAIAYGCANAAEKMPKDVKAFPVNYWDALTAEESRRVLGAEERPAREPRRDVRRAARSTRTSWTWTARTPSFHRSPTTPCNDRARCTRRSSSPSPGSVYWATKIRHLGRRARVHSRGGRALPRGRRPLDAGRPREHREDVRGDAAALACAGDTRLWMSPGTPKGTVPGTLNRDSPRSEPHDELDRLHATARRTARCRPDARAVAARTARCCSPTWARASSRSSSPAAATTRAPGDRRSLEGESAYFLSINRNKESVTLDFKQPEGRAILEQLHRRAPTCWSRTSVPARSTGSGSTTRPLAARYPRLVYCSISGFGQTGPRRDEPGYDAVIQAEGGLMSITGAADGPPLRLGVAIADIVTGMFAAQGVAMALLARDAHRPRTAGGHRHARRDCGAADLSGRHLLRHRQRAGADGQPAPDDRAVRDVRGRRRRVRARRRERRPVAPVLRGG